MTKWYNYDIWCKHCEFTILPTTDSPLPKKCPNCGKENWINKQTKGSNDTTQEYMGQCLWCGEMIEATVTSDQDIVMAYALHDKCNQPILLEKKSKWIGDENNDR